MRRVRPCLAKDKKLNGQRPIIQAGQLHWIDRLFSFESEWKWLRRAGRCVGFVAVNFYSNKNPILFDIIFDGWIAVFWNDEAIISQPCLKCFCIAWRDGRRLKNADNLSAKNGNVFCRRTRAHAFRSARGQCRKHGGKLNRQKKDEHGTGKNAESFPEPNEDCNYKQINKKDALQNHESWTCPFEIADNNANDNQDASCHVQQVHSPGRPDEEKQIEKPS